MDTKYTALTSELYHYLVDHGTPRESVLTELAQETAELGPLSLMQISPEQGALMTLLVRAIGARSAVEVGTFTGYSAICIARGLAPGGRLLCCDVSDQWTSIARRYWARAGLADRIELRLAPALETLRALPVAQTIDFAFVDADKLAYRAYYEEILQRLRPNGLILFDNVLWMGQVTDPHDTSEDTTAMRALNDLLAADPQVQTVMLPVSDGLTIVRKRATDE
ncbi:MAG: O-methyltransferase [Deltaproteobacteria bacterium]|nr:O-methyltransferase [Deltaproteobacteria bacterium]